MAFAIVRRPSFSREARFLVPVAQEAQATERVPPSEPEAEPGHIVLEINPLVLSR